MGMPLKDIEESIENELGVEGIVSLVDNQLHDTDKKIFRV